MQQTPGIEITASRGIHSVSYSVIPRGNCVDVPLGCSVVRWDLQQRQQVAVLAQLESVVTSVVASPCGTMVATSTYDGWVSLFSTQEGEAWKLLSQTKALTPPVKHAVFSHDSRHLAVVASGRNDYRPSVLVVWEIHDGQLKQCFQLQGTNFRCEFINNEELLCWRNSPAQLAVVSLVSGEDVRTLTMPQPSLDWQSGYAVDSELHLVAVAQKGRHVSVVDTTSLAIVDSFAAPGSGSIYTMLWWADSLVVYEGGGEYAVLSISGERVNSFSGPSHPSHLCWHVRDFMLSVATPEALSLLKVRLHSPQRKHDARLDETAGHKMSVDDLSLSFHALGCCGVCFDPTGFFAVAGDLQGNLIVWSATQSEPICRVRVPVGVRSLSWQHGAVFVGCFDGALYRWVPDANALARAALGPQQGEEPGDDDDEADAHAEGGSLELVALLSSCITCMEWHHDLLALGTTDGRVTVLHHDKTRSASHLAIRNCFLAHAPVQSSDAEFVERFGSLHLKADIWGITWSPDGTMIGTSSEDQSTRIWDLEGKLLQTLTGHTLAVTCVDWKLLHSGSSLLATASDDRQVQLWLWDGSSFELSAVIHTDAVDGWFTLTYLTVLPNGHIVAGTENGHVLIWSADGTLLDHRRVHGASIEGMSYSPVSQLVVTCASDCTLAFVRAHA